MKFSYNTLRWKATARAVIEANGFRCVIPGCQERWFLQVHHIVPVGLCRDPWDVRNLEPRCPKHHAFIHRLQRVPDHWRTLEPANDAQMELPLTG